MGNERNQLKRKKQRTTQVIVCIKWLIALMFLAGAAIFSYPFFADAYNNIRDQQMINAYEKTASKKNQQQQKRMEQLAKKNHQLKKTTLIPGMGEVADPFEEQIDGNEKPGKAFYKKHMLGAIYIPKVNISLPIFDKTNDLFLNKGATVLQGTSFPIGGKNTHSVITGHSGLPDKKLFTDIEQLTEGDLFYVEVLGKKMAYRINRIQIVLPTEIESLEIREGKELITLVTCTPYMVNTHRLLVTGHRIPYKKAMTKEIQKAQGYHWWRWGALVAAAVTLSSCLTYWGYRRWVRGKASRKKYPLQFFAGKELAGESIIVQQKNMVPKSDKYRLEE